MYGYIKVTADDELTVHATSSVLDNDDLQDAVGGYYEVVRPGILQDTVWENVRILCDEEGLYREHPKINKLASALYAAPYPIVGDVVLCTTDTPFDVPYQSEPDIWPFDKFSLPAAEDFFTRLLEKLKSAKL